MRILIVIILSYISTFVTGETMLKQPVNNAVYQRKSDSAGVVPVVVSDASIERILWKYKPNQDWQNLHFIKKNNTVSGTINLPTAGWYNLEFRFFRKDTEDIEHKHIKIGIGEVFITAGQSNSANWGKPRQCTKTGNTVVFDGKKWRLANDPLPICDGDSGSIWPIVGDDLSQLLDMPIGFLCLGVGGSSVKQWNPENKTVHKQLYGRFKKYVPLLKPYGVRAVLWHQGETDRMSRKDVYYSNLKDIILRFKSDFGEIPWLVAIVGNQWMNVSYGVGCRAAQQEIIDDALAYKGPDTDLLGAQYRLKEGKSSHFNQAGLEAHAAMWSKSIMKFINSRNNK